MNRSGSLFLAPALCILTFIFALPIALLFIVSFWSVKSFRLRPDFTFTAWQHFVDDYGGLTVFTLFVGLIVGLLCTTLGFIFAFAAPFKAGIPADRPMSAP